MSVDHTTIISAYTVEYTAKNDNGNPDCHVWIKGPDGTYSASLQALMDNGVLENSWGYEHKVHQSDIDAIEEWANARGWDQ